MKTLLAISESRKEIKTLFGIVGDLGIFFDMLNKNVYHGHVFFILTMNND